MTSLLLSLLIAGPTWSGEFTLTITGVGQASAKPSSTGDWVIRRQARGTILLDRTFLGAGIAGSPDGKNEKRYETWIANVKQPIQMQIHDRIHLRAPLFSPKEIRDDVTTYDCPVSAGPDAWQDGKVGSPTLQLDLKEGKYLWDSPRFYATVRKTFLRKFVSGPPKWVANKPISTDGIELEFEMIHGLGQPREWFRLAGPYKPDQTEIVLSRKFAFGVPLGTTILGKKVDAELKLVLRKS